MGETLFVGPMSEFNQIIDTQILKAAILRKWNDAEFRDTEIENINFGWDVIQENWYIESLFINGNTLSIVSNKDLIIAEAVIWFYSLFPQDDLYVYNDNTLDNPLKLSKEVDVGTILQWLKFT